MPPQRQRGRSCTQDAAHCHNCHCWLARQQRASIPTSWRRCVPSPTSSCRRPLRSSCSRRETHTPDMCCSHPSTHQACSVPTNTPSVLWSRSSSNNGGTHQRCHTPVAQHADTRCIMVTGHPCCWALGRIITSRCPHSHTRPGSMRTPTAEHDSATALQMLRMGHKIGHPGSSHQTHSRVQHTHTHQFLSDGK